MVAVAAAMEVEMTVAGWAGLGALQEARRAASVVVEATAVRKGLGWRRWR